MANPPNKLILTRDQIASFVGDDPRAIKQIEKLYEQKSAITGVATGYADIDRMTSGLQPADLIIIAGRPSMGKTAFALNMGLSAALQKTPVAVFSPRAKPARSFASAWRSAASPPGAAPRTTRSTGPAA